MFLETNFWKYINMIKQWLNKDLSGKESFFAFFLLLGIFIYPLINNNLPFRDDYVRLLKGNAWETLGRGSANTLMHILSFNIGGLTNTLRIRHRTLVNLIKPSAPYGEYVRSLIKPPEGMVMIGSDISALESATRNNFVYNKPDIQIHPRKKTKRTRKRLFRIFRNRQLPKISLDKISSSSIKRTIFRKTGRHLRKWPLG